MPSDKDKQAKRTWGQQGESKRITKSSALNRKEAIQEQTVKQEDRIQNPKPHEATSTPGRAGVQPS